MYGAEILEKYGEETVRKSNEHYLNQVQATCQRAEQLAAEIITHLVNVRKCMFFAIVGFVYPCYTESALPQIQ